MVAVFRRRRYVVFGFESCLHWVLIISQKRNAEEDSRANQSPLSASKPGDCECSVPNLESVLRERLQKIAGDEEVQDLARAILCHLTSATGVSPSAAASSPEVGFRCSYFIYQVLMVFSKLNTCSTEPDEGANLSRSHALKGAAAEAAKASFKAHRAEVADKTELSPTSPTHSAAPSSLSIIEDIRSALTKLSTGFSLPSSLDFSDDEPDGLAYTTTNTPVRVYEHALNKLLEQLDAVESDGDEEVRMVRRAAVKEVEERIEDVEKRIREARESTRPGDNAVSANSAEAADGNPPVDNDKPKAEDLSSKSGDCVDSAPSRPDILPIPKPESAAPNVSEPSDFKSIGSPSLATTEEIEDTVFSDDVSESIHDSGVFAEQATSDEITSALSEPEILITPPDSPAEVSVPMLGAIAPSSTPVAPLVLSIIPDELPASLGRDRLPVALGENNAELDGDDDEGEWTEI